MGSNGKTATVPGRNTTFNETEFTALSQPVGVAKPGKLPHEVACRLALPKQEARRPRRGRTRFCGRQAYAATMQKGRR